MCIFGIKFDNPEKNQFIMRLSTFIILCLVPIFSLSAQQKEISFFQCENDHFYINQLHSHHFLNPPYDKLGELGVQRIIFSPKQSGELNFSIVPDYSYDDFDFVLEKIDLISGSRDIIIKNIDGPELSKDYNLSSIVTGLSSQDHSLPIIDDRSYQSITVSANEYYLITIINTTSDLGFSIDFSKNEVLLKSFESLDFESRSQLNSMYTLSDLGDCRKVSSNFISLYPTLSTNGDILTIESTNGKINSVDILSLNGQWIKSQQINLAKGQVSCHNFSPGLYLAKVNLENGQATTKKFVVVD